MLPSGFRTLPNLVASTTWCRRPRIARPTSSSLWPQPYMSEVSRKFTPRSSGWASLARGELTVESFLAPFEADCRVHGVEVNGARLMAAIADAGRSRPRMLAAIRRIRERGLRVAALTNNWVAEGRRPTDGLRAHFDVFVESAVVGLRKPDPRIYELVCRELGVAPSRVAFLDDIGRNLKPARELGMTTIKVEDPDQALRELSALLGFDLID